MMRISYRRMFWGSTLMAVVFSAILLILLFLMKDPNEDVSDYALGAISNIICSPLYGLSAMLVLKIFGKKEEPVAPAKEEPKEKIVYVIKEEPKEHNENKEDDTRYMPR